MCLYLAKRVDKMYDAEGYKIVIKHRGRYKAPFADIYYKSDINVASPVWVGLKELYHYGFHAYYTAREAREAFAINCTFMPKNVVIVKVMLYDIFNTGYDNTSYITNHIPVVTALGMEILGEISI